MWFKKPRSLTLFLVRYEAEYRLAFSHAWPLSQGLDDPLLLGIGKQKTKLPRRSKHMMLKIIEMQRPRVSAHQS